MNLKTDTCPVEVFKPKSNWNLSLTENKDSYERQIKECERKLELLRDERVDEYVNEKFDEYDKFVDEANEKIKLYKSYVRNEDLSEDEKEDVEDAIEELKKQNDLLPEYVESKLKHMYHKDNHLYPEMNYRKQFLC